MPPRACARSFVRSCVRIADCRVGCRRCVSDAEWGDRRKGVGFGAACTIELEIDRIRAPSNEWVHSPKRVEEDRVVEVFQGVPVLDHIWVVKAAAYIPHEVRDGIAKVKVGILLEDLVEPSLVEIAWEEASKECPLPPLEALVPTTRPRRKDVWRWKRPHGQRRAHNLARTRNR